MCQCQRPLASHPHQHQKEGCSPETAPMRQDHQSQPDRPTNSAISSEEAKPQPSRLRRSPVPVTRVQPSRRPPARPPPHTPRRRLRNAQECAPVRRNTCFAVEKMARPKGFEPLTPRFVGDGIYCRAIARWLTMVHKRASGLTETVWR